MHGLNRTSHAWQAAARVGIALFYLDASLAWTAACRGASPAEPPRPNIVLILADDLGWGDLGCYGHPRCAAPHLDRLAREGTRFYQCYAGGCLCSPTRASLLTGQFPSRQRMFEHLSQLPRNTQRKMPHWLDPPAALLPGQLQRGGYHTAIVGKWHLGGGSADPAGPYSDVNHPDAPEPTQYGFDFSRVAFGNGPTWRLGVPHPRRHDIYPYHSDTEWTRHSCEFITDEALRILDEHRARRPDQPWALFVWYHEPHVPLDPPPRWQERFADLPRLSQLHYAAIGHMDEQIGRLLQRLDQHGAAQDTLVLFTSDNGAAAGRGGSNGSLRGTKWTLHEGGIRVPLIARWPRQVPADREDRTSVVHACDLTPTLSALAGAALPETFEPDGVDVLPALRGRAWQRSQPLFWEHRYARPGTGPQLAMRSGRWKFTLFAAPEETALYDLEADPAESRNLASEQSEIAAQMKAALLDWRGTLP